MKFQASFLENHINISTKECNRIFGLGRITFGIATGNYGALSILFPVQELDTLRDKANSLLEFCFSSKKGEDKLSAYYKCEEEFSLCGGCIMSEKKAIVNTDDNIDMVETYWLTKLSGLLLVEMMYAILHNIPILKCPVCKRFFIADNHGIQYCDNIYKDGKTCRQIGAKKQFKEKVKSDSALSLYEKKYQALYYKRKKTTEEKALTAIKEKIAFYQDARSKYKKGEISSDEFISVLEE